MDDEKDGTVNSSRGVAVDASTGTETTSDEDKVTDTGTFDETDSKASETAPWESEEYTARTAMEEDQTESGAMSPDERQIRPSPSSEPRQPRENSAEEGNTVSMQLKNEEGTDENEVETEDPQKRELEQLMSFMGDGFVVPEDFEIGPLQTVDATGEIDTILVIARNFFEALSKGRIEERLIHPEWVDVVTQSLSYHIENGRIPIRIRFGRIEIADEARANIRMYSEKGRTEGEIFFDGFEGSWYITDIQADFTELDIEYQDDNQRYEPVSYRWLEIY